MERSKAEAVIEAILFTMGDSVEISRLAEVIEEDVKTTKSILKDMAARYEEENRGIGLTQFDNSVQLCTKSDMYEYLIKIAKTPRKMTLTDTVLETLSIIAYKQPVTRLEIERVRGVSCDHAINKLLEYDLITELGRLDVRQLDQVLTVVAFVFYSFWPGIALRNRETGHTHFANWLSL